MLSLLDIEVAGNGDRVAVIQVNETIYEARVGETFGQDRFLLLEILDEQVVVQFGDEILRPREGGSRVMK